MPHTSLFEAHHSAIYIVHIHTKYTFKPITLYIFIPSTPSSQSHYTYSCQVYLCALYIFMTSTHLRHRWLASCSIWSTEMAETGRLQHYQPCQTGYSPRCKINSSKPCPTPALQPLFVHTGWLHFFSWIPSSYLFPPSL